jgi:hypothetical protein
MADQPRPTKDRLADELLAVAEKASPANAAQYRALADRAATGEFDDFGTAHACGPTALHRALLDLGFTKFAARVADGEFDATREESDAWANSPEGRAAMQDFTPAQRAALFGVYDG